MSQKFNLNRIALVKGVNMAHQTSPEIVKGALPPILQKHEQEIRLYQEIFGPVIGSLIFAVGILSDVQHMQVNDPHVIQELNEAKALIVIATKSIPKPQGS
jgi:hypothetical protein